MKPEEIRQAIRLLGGLFPSQVTQEHAKLLSKEFAPLAYVAVVKGIHEHRKRPDLKDGFWHMGRLLEACHAAEHKASNAPQNNGDRAPDWCDLCRQQNPQFATVGDYEVILRVHRQWWHGRGRPASYRGGIESSCHRLLVSHGMTTEEAARWATWAMDSEPEDFRHALEELRVADGRRTKDEAASAILLIRASDPKTYHQGMGDVAAIIHFYSAAWAKVAHDPANPAGTSGARVYLFAHCRSALMEAGVGQEEAVRTSREVVGLGPREPLVLRSIFKGLPPAGQTSWDAIQSLARVEYGVKAQDESSVAASVST